MSARQVTITEVASVSGLTRKRVRRMATRAQEGRAWFSAAMALDFPDHGDGLVQFATLPDHIREAFVMLDQPELPLPPPQWHNLAPQIDLPRDLRTNLTLKRTIEMAQSRTVQSRRNSDLAMIHIGAKRLFGDVSKGDDGREAYEDWLERNTGKRSAGKLTTGQRIDLIKRMRRDGLIPDRGRGGIGQTAAGEDRPTSQQWAKIAALGRSMGWAQGLEDDRLQSFVTRTAKVASTRFLSRAQASKVITGLGVWVATRGVSDDAL